MERIYWTVEFELDFGFEVRRMVQVGSLAPVTEVVYGWLSHAEVYDVLESDSTAVLKGFR